ncbi:MDR family MFS transporter [Novosphingobium sp. KN65.2]|uniref:MDR family MFS transporter n=1 Tax=Novosphingobium sp. KN65.2 TaxID=1478134 RepID=UPI0005DFDC87|nr:MDR family MFS transporter [Novosphingobium sp. KN65.2]CDO36672.1 putative drug resistance transporter, EmrB-FarB-QacA family [Novosphingobium sp. KN65.2]
MSSEQPIQYPSPARRILITIPSMIASTMVFVDITIANVALPHMQASLSASQEQVLWVLTSYLVAGAIATPLSGWLAGRVGRKNVMLFSVGGFTLASMLCGISTDLGTIVFARFLQGSCGAALVPLSQAILLDINPPKDHAKAMAIFTIGSLAGPIIGPTLGGYLTDTLSWRWVFFINVPFGILAFIGMLVFLVRRQNRECPPFDKFGFLTISIALAALQLLLDRGEHLDWFDSNEIRIYGLILVIALYLATIHLATSANPFIRPELFKDRNFAVSTLVNTLLGMVTFASMPMIVVMTQSLLGYSAMQTGLVSLPRTLGAMIAMIAVTRLVALIEARFLLLTGMIIMSIGMLMYSNLDLFVDERTLVVTGFVLGLGSGLLFVPLSVVAFSTLQPRLRNEGTAMYALTRNIGNAAGISLLQFQYSHFAAQSQNSLVQGVRPDNPIMQYMRPDFDFNSVEALAGMKAQIMRQAAMVGDISVYHLIFLATVVTMPLVLLLRGRQTGKVDAATLPHGE